MARTARRHPECAKEVMLTKEALALGKEVEAKEAAIKWQGGALATDLVHWSWSGQQEMATHLDLALSVRIHQLAHQDWWMAVAANARDVAGQAPQLCLA